MSEVVYNIASKVLTATIFILRHKTYIVTSFRRPIFIYDLKVCDDGTLVKILCFWTLSIVLSLSKSTVLFIFQNTTFRRLYSVSVFR
jgi:hypothetical protein